MNDFDLNGRVALVTGGSGQLGWQMAQALSDYGAKVVLGARRKEVCVERAATLVGKGRDAFGLSLDVTNKASVEAARDQVIEKYGKIDILVNNAGGGCAIKPFEDYSTEEWNRAMALNSTGTFLCSQVIGTQMKADGGGVIINIASVYGIVAADQRIYGNSGLNNPGVYAMAKGGVIAFTRYLAAYWAKEKIRVNSISPGGFFNNQAEDFLKNYCWKTPLARMGDGEDLRGAVVYLASDASKYITGHNLVVDGGFTIW